jgi:hypothetical protein
MMENNTKYFSWPGLLIDPLKITTADAGDVLLRITYSADIVHMNQ